MQITVIKEFFYRRNPFADSLSLEFYVHVYMRFHFEMLNSWINAGKFYYSKTFLNEKIRTSQVILVNFTVN